MDTVNDLEKVKPLDFSDLEKPFSLKQIAAIVGGCLAVFLLILQLLLSSGKNSSYLKDFDFSKNNNFPKSAKEVAGAETYGPPGRPSPTPIIATSTPEPTSTPSPTSTPTPETSSPSNNSEPTPTPTPTPTLEPTAKPIPISEEHIASNE